MGAKELLELRVSHNGDDASMRQFVKFVLWGFSLNLMALSEYKDWRRSYYLALQSAGVISGVTDAGIPEDQEQQADNLLYMLIRYVFDERYE